MIQLLHTFVVIRDSCIVEKNCDVESSTGNSQLIEGKSERNEKNLLRAENINSMNGNSIIEKKEKIQYKTNYN